MPTNEQTLKQKILLFLMQIAITLLIAFTKIFI